MARVVVGMTMSLDGFINDRNGEVSRLYPDFDAAGLADEAQIDLRPILLGGGLRLFDQLARAPIELETARVTESPGVTHLQFRVVR